MRRGVSVALVMLLAAGGNRAFAQRRGPILHEAIPDDADDDRRHQVASGINGFHQSSKGLIPVSREGGGPKPDPSLAGFEHSFVPDRDTRAPEILAGGNVFDPSISPYERVAAYDSVLADFTLSVADPSSHPLTKGGAPGDADTFRARFEIGVARDRAVRIPGVIAGSTLVDSNVTFDGRPIAHRLVSDGAENWFVVASETGRALLRLTIAAPRSAFGGAFGNPDWSTLPKPRELPDGPRRSAAIVLERLGASRRETPAQSVERLTRYFREFKDSKDPPSGNGDIYRDIALSKKGVCRHRAYAFLITASALGLPTRLIMNTEHAWVEVHNGTLWKRIDLGGGGTILNPERNEVASYREPPDPFAWPAGASSGRDTMQNGRKSSGGTGGSGAALAAASTSASARSSAELPQEIPPETHGPRASITLANVTKDVLRGAALDISGDVRAADRACPFVGVDVALVAKTGNARSIALGALSTDNAGHFSGALTVPSAISLGDYRVVAKTRGGKSCGPGGSP